MTYAEEGAFKTKAVQCTEDVRLAMEAEFDQRPWRASRHYITMSSGPTGNLSILPRSIWEEVLVHRGSRRGCGIV